MVNEKLLKNLLAPGKGTGKFNDELNKVFGVLLNAIGYRAKIVAKNLIRYPGSEGAKVGVKLQEASLMTRTLRQRRRKQVSPLYEYGHLLSAITYQVDEKANRVFVGIPQGIMSKPRRPGQKPVELATLLRRLEEGRTITVTEKMRRYFLFMARTYEQGKQANMASKGQHPLAGYHAQRAGGWEFLAGFAVGKVFEVPPRPVIRPAVQFAIKKVKQSGGGPIADAVMQAWATGTAPTTMGQGKVLGPASGAPEEGA